MTNNIEKQASNNISNIIIFIKHILLVINFLAILFIILYSVIRPQGNYVNALGICTLIIIILDFVYLAFAKDYISTLLIVVLSFAFWLIYYLNILVHFNFFPNSINVFSIIFFALSPLATIVYIVIELFFKNSERTYKYENYFTQIILFIIAIASLFFTVMSYDLVNNIKNSSHYYVEMDYFHFFISIFMLILILKFFIGKKKIKKNVTLFVLIVLMLSYSIINFSKPIFSINADIKASYDYYTNAFSEQALMNESATRKMPINIIVSFVGIPTKNVESKKDILYYECFEGKDAGLKLYYDVYYNKALPENASVLIRMHGWNCDKSNANNPQYDKYFASLGYVVFDIQYGVFSEKQEGEFKKPYVRDLEEYLFFIREFIKYAKDNSDEYNANFDSVFISGHSFGGSMTLGIGLNLNKNKPEYDYLGIKVKGIIPFYPGWDGVTGNGWDFHNLVDENSIPCLMMMGWNDNTVNTDSAYVIGDFYKKYNNNN